VWQVLPLGPTGFGNSPYQLFSAFAGNPLLISLDPLAGRGWLTATDVHPPSFAEDTVDFPSVIPWKLERLRRAAARFRDAATADQRSDFAVFCRAHCWWLDDFALFLAVKVAHGGEAIWTKWEPDIARRHPPALDHWRQRLAVEIETEKFIQWEFANQWNELK